MGVNGQKLNFQANGRRWRDLGVEIAWNSFLSIYFIAIAFSKTFFSIKVEVGSRGYPKRGANGGNWQKIEFPSKWREMAGQWGGNSLE